ncbi:MAG TPA: rubrerythrin family protein [Lachnospiraceae bacterium]|nr:rubrerythrin family protein [Lachnospiraceae bacterium]HEX3076657.1 rubrerythrin family protein [Lachnospiraceae bacterium]
MSMDFKNSITKENLMKAFAGESQARNRYTLAAGIAKKQNLYIVDFLFTFTANQEKEHAEIFYKHLKDLAGENIEITGAFPIDYSDNLEELLLSAQHNEYEEAGHVYLDFGAKAKEEGFDKIAYSFLEIAKIEQTHGDRFGKVANMIKNNQLFVSNVQSGFMCLNCGYIYEGTQAPKVCPVCQYDQGYFLSLELLSSAVR